MAASVSLSTQQSEAVLSVVWEPAQGLFGTVTVKFPVTEANSSAESQDLTPSRGYIVLEEGVRFKVRCGSFIFNVAEGFSKGAPYLSSKGKEAFPTEDFLQTRRGVCGPNEVQLEKSLFMEQGREK